MKKLLEYIRKSVVEGKTIHVGAVGTSRRKRLVRHKFYKKHAKFIVGFDYNSERVKIAHEEGCLEIFKADVTNSEDISEIIENYGTFDNVIMTEVIEHVGNLTLALDNVRRLMSDNSKLFISTPDISRALLKRSVNSDHICWFCEVTMRELLRRSRLKITEIFVEEYNLLAIAEKEKV